MRRLAAPFVVAPPSGARIRTRLRLSACDKAVIRAVGEQLGRLAGQDLAARCRLGWGDDQRAERKRALTPASSSRWAGSITRTSNDQWQQGRKNLLAERERLRRACRTIRARLAVPVGARRGRVRGYASQAERFQSSAACSTWRPSLPRWSADRGESGVGVSRWPHAREAPPRP